MFITPDYSVPGKNGEITFKKGSILDKEEFENLKNEYYELRGWDTESGYQIEDTMKELYLHDIGKKLDRLGLLRKVNRKK
jgi:aldehyde:ferredoxin oxidoreductase